MVVTEVIIESDGPTPLTVDGRPSPTVEKMIVTRFMYPLQLNRQMTISVATYTGIESSCDLMARFFVIGNWAMGHGITF
jgi:hypothetical protein